VKDAGIALSEESSEESSESEDEDEDGELAPLVADSFLSVLPMIASHNPEIYKTSTKFFPGVYLPPII